MDQPQTLHVTKTREELIATFQRTFTAEGVDLTQYWGNIANLVTQNEGKLTVSTLYHWMAVITAIEVEPGIITDIPEWLPSMVKRKICKYRVEHISRYIKPTEEKCHLFSLLHGLFSTMVFCMTDDQNFINEFEQYTEIPVNYDNEEMACI